jgi:hypothetical protein
MKIIYNTATNEVVGSGSDGISVEAPYAVADAPANWDDYPIYFWTYVNPDIVLKTGQDLIDAQNRQKAETATRLIDKYTAALGNALAVIGSMEEMLDINNQIVQKLMNGDAITQDEKDAYNLAVNTCAPQYKLLLANVDQTVVDAMLAKKAAARAVETALKNDPEWPY